MTGQTVIPGYRILRELGRGGMGTVYLAVQESLGREVALKLLTPQLAADPLSTERFLREGRIVARLTNRHIVSIYDVGVHAGQPYLAMEYMSGGAVAAGTLHEPSRALGIVRDIALALDHAHAEGVIHRDLKPENILRRKDGSHALADFGIARATQIDGSNDPTLTQEGATLGTPYYMSPEQLQAQPLDGRSDLYSLGVVLYQLLANKLPYRGTGDMPVGMQHIHSPVPHLPEHLERYQPLVDALMAKSPDRRPASGADVAKRIEAMQTNPDVAPVTQPIDAQPSGRRTRWQLTVGLLLVAGAIAVYVATTQLTRHRRVGGDAAASAPNAADATRTSKTTTSAEPTTAAPEPSVAVLPLINASDDKDQQFFSDGLSENLIDTLSRFDGLKVIGRMSSFQFRDGKGDSAAIGSKLGATYLLSGSVQRASDVVRISASLIRAADGSTLWAQHYDRPYKNLFALQDEIAQAVAGALQVKLLSPEAAAKQDDRPPSGSLDAYNAYLQGLKYWHDQAFPKSAEYMAKAVQLDPGYAIAWAHLSGAWSTVATFWKDPAEPADELLRKARIAVDKALQLAPDLGAAHAARAYLSVYRFDHRGASAECHRALRLAPEDGTVLNGCGIVLAQLGKLDEAIPLRQHLLSIEPLYAVNDLRYADVLMAIGRLDDAEKYLRIAEDLSKEPNTYQHMLIAMLRGDADAAMDIATQMPADKRALRTVLASQLGPDRTAADTALKIVLQNKALGGADGPFKEYRSYTIAQAYALRGDAGHAVEWLEQSPTSKLLYILADPLILNVRDDPRFIAFCEKIGLPPPSESDALSIDQIRAAAKAKG